MAKLSALWRRFVAWLDRFLSKRDPVADGLLKAFLDKQTNPDYLWNVAEDKSTPRTLN